MTEAWLKSSGQVFPDLASISLTPVPIELPHTLEELNTTATLVARTSRCMGQSLDISQIHFHLETCAASR